MSQLVAKDPKVSTFAFNGGPAWERLITELAINVRRLNRSQIMRDALIEKADRDLPANWREIVKFDEENAA